MEYEPLSTLVELLCRGNAMHISVWDFSGLLQWEPLRVDLANQFHSVPFCGLAKSTRKGYRLCIRCKERANRKARVGKVPFSGYCVCGLFEAAYPVVLDGQVRCVVYAGNLTPDLPAAEERLRRTAGITGAPAERMAEELRAGEHSLTPEDAERAARLVGSYIRLLGRDAPWPVSPRHWAVERLLEAVREHYAYPITLRDLAAVCYFNEKYVGRLFKAQTGQSFHQYLAAYRLDRAEEMLREGSRAVADVARECGFESTSYFNRLFRERFGRSPGAYRKETGFSSENLV